MKYNFDEINNRLGTYCTQWDYIEDRFGEKDLLPFSISDTDFKIPKPISKTIQKVSQSELYGYTRWNHEDFKGSIAQFYKRRHDCEMNLDWIVYSPSVMYSVSLLIRLLSKPKDKVVTLNPMYDSFFTVTQDNDRQLESHYLQAQNGTYEINFSLLEMLPFFYSVHRIIQQEEYGRMKKWRKSFQFVKNTELKSFQMKSIWISN